MPRAVRHEYPGAVYHAMCRGNNGQDIFIKDDGRRLFLSTLGEVCLQTGWKVHAYVLMSNHYHLLLETPEPNLVAGMKWFQGTYTQRFNAMFKRRGHLFQGRYKALPIEVDNNVSEYFREVGQYIHLNPFRAGLAGLDKAKPLEQYVWSSYPAYIGTCKKPPEWLLRGRLYSACNLEQGKAGYLSRYRAMVESRMLGEAESLSDSVHQMVEKQLKWGWYIGEQSFRNVLVEMIDTPSDNLRGEQRRAHDEKEAERLIHLALDVLDLKEAQLLEMKSTRSEKQAVAWLLKKHTTVTVAWLATRLNMGHRTNASRVISSFDRDATREVKLLKQKMLQFTG